MPTRKRILLALLSAVVTFALIEAGSSWALHHVYAGARPPEGVRLPGHINAPTMPDAYLGRRIRPSVQERRITTNVYGLRNGPVDAVPDENTVRVLLLGGSTAWGYTSRSNEDTIAACLERWFTEHQLLPDTRVEVLNGAVPGYVCWQGVLSYAMDRRRLAPDVIITLDGANEVHSAIRHGRAGWTLSAKGSPKVRSLGDALKAWASYRAGRLKSVKLKEALWPAPLDAQRVPVPAEVGGAYRSALDTLGDFARAEGALVVGVLQPMCILAGTKPLTPFEEDVRLGHDAKMPGRNAYYAACYDAMRAALAALGEERDDLLPLDASRVFESVEELVFVDHCHLTEEGRKHVAAFLGAQLTRHVAAHGLPGRWR